MMVTTRLVIMAKAPQPGLAKTRLMPALGAQGAADLAQAMLMQTVQTALDACGEDIHAVTVCAAPDPHDAAWSRVSLPPSVTWWPQGEGDLGERMARAVKHALSKHERVLLIGTDLVGLDAALLQNAARALHTHEVSLVPTFDGGYGLIGLRRWHNVFDHMPWSTSEVFALTQQRLQQASPPVSHWVGPCLRDIDEPADLVHIQTGAPCVNG